MESAEVESTKQSFGSAFYLPKQILQCILKADRFICIDAASDNSCESHAQRSSCLAGARQVTSKDHAYLQSSLAQALKSFRIFLTAAAAPPLYQLLTRGTCCRPRSVINTSHLFYVGPLSPQLSASAMKPSLPPIRETFVTSAL